jgi:hypothetical protein
MHDDGAYGPLSFRWLDDQARLVFFRNWWGNRAIPDTRPNLSESLIKLGVASAAELASVGFGLSLSDQYWIKDVNEDIDWHSINYFEHPFSDEVGRLLMSPSIEMGQFAGSTAAPSNTTDGVLPKRWSIIDGEITMLKGATPILFQEPYNELIATHLYSLLLDSKRYVNYRLYNDGSEIISACPNMLNSHEEFIPALYLAFPDGRSSHKLMPEQVSTVCIDLGIDDMQTFVSQFIVCDYILANRDRHLRNFGIIRDVDSMQFRIGPLFDSGAALWNDVNTLVGGGKLDYSSRPFHRIPEQQLDVVSDWEWFDSTKLEGFDSYLFQTLVEGPLKGDQIRTEIIVRAVQARINTVISHRDK